MTERQDAAQLLAYRPEQISSEELEGKIRAWLSNYLGSLFNIAPADVRSSMKFQHYGLDSSAAVGLSGDLGNWLGCSIEPTVAYDHPSIDGLACSLARDPAVLSAFGKRHSLVERAS